MRSCVYVYLYLLTCQAVDQTCFYFFVCDVTKPIHYSVTARDCLVKIDYICFPNMRGLECGRVEL